MTDRPILFSGAMVRAILDGRKTMTRRVLKPQPRDGVEAASHRFGWDWVRGGSEPWPLGRVAPPYSPGDRLWVREAWKPHSTFDHMKPREMPPTAKVFYLADGGYSPPGSRGRPGIHMPRFVSRLTLTVTDVRVERVQDISEADAKAEGIKRVFIQVPCGNRVLDQRMFGVERGDPQADFTARSRFSSLWDSLNAKRGYAWEDNPWIVAVSFDVHTCNIDQMANAERSE